MSKDRIENVVSNMIEIEFVDEDGFSKVKETLTRIGIMNKQEKKLYQSCHIFHRQGHYYISHFKEMMMLDNKPVDFNDDDIKRRNRIVNILEKWNFLKALKEDHKLNMIRRDKIEILPYIEKEEWELIPKYNIGVKH